MFRFELNNMWAGVILVIIVANFAFQANSEMVLTFSLLVIFFFLFQYINIIFTNYADLDIYTEKSSTSNLFKTICNLQKKQKNNNYILQELPEFLSVFIILANSNIKPYRCVNFSKKKNYFFIYLSFFINFLSTKLAKSYYLNYKKLGVRLDFTNYFLGVVSEQFSVKLTFEK